MCSNQTPSALNKLSAGTVRQIASAQVITSVFSVIKELVENSLDAGAKCIEIKLENYGFNKIEIRDNGCGVKPVDAEYMAVPHYTSKINTADDLHHLQTYGFRGEALGALCNVAEVTITTKTAQDETGTQYTLSNKGEIIDRRPSHLSTGTTVGAVNLFKNLPVRKQYYSTTKKCREELKRVEDLIIAYSIIQHDVRFWLRHNKDLLYQNTAVNSPRDVLIKVFGSTVMASMEKFKNNWLDPEMKIELFLPKKTSKWQQLSRSNSDRTFMYVNKRPVQMKSMEKLLKRHFNKAMGCDNRSPMAFISIQLPPEYIDVNLEPNKTRVFLQQEQTVSSRFSEVLTEIYGAIEEASAKKLPSPKQIEDSLNSSDTSISNESLLGIGLSLPTTKPSNEKLSMFVDEVLKNTETNDREQEKWDNDIMHIEQEHIDHAPLTESTHTTPNKEMTSDTADSILRAPDFIDTSLPLTQSTLSFDLVGDDFLSSTQNNGKIQAADVQSSRPDFTSVENIQPSELSSQNCEAFQHQGDMLCPKTLETIARATENVVGASNRANAAVEADKPASIYERPGVALHESDAATSAMDWSKGTSVSDKDGKVIEPVMVVTGRAATSDNEGNLRPTMLSLGKVDEKSLSESPGANRMTFSFSNADRSFPSEPSVSSIVKTPVSKPKTSTCVTPDQPSLFDIGKDIKKPTTAFIFFSKEIRQTVIRENPCADFQEIAKIIGQKWKSLEPRERAKYDNMMSTDFQREEKRKLSSPSLSIDQKINNKRRKLETNGEKPSRSKKPAEDEKYPVHEVRVDFSLTALKQFYEDGGYHSQSGRTCSTKLHLIGQLQTNSLWFGIHDNQICAFYPVRAQEMLIYHRLLANHSLPTERLETPMCVLPSMLSEGTWLTLLGMEKSEMPRTDVYTYFCDPRLVKNGFNVRQYQKGEEVQIEITGMFRDMNMYGLKDMQEILQVVRDNPACHLRHCRSTKIRQFLQGEAVRMSRHLPQRLSREETKDLLEEIYKQLPVSTTTCFHKKPFLKPVYDLQCQDLTPSQAPDFSQAQSS